MVYSDIQNVLKGGGGGGGGWGGGGNEDRDKTLHCHRMNYTTPGPHSELSEQIRGPRLV